MSIATRARSLWFRIPEIMGRNVTFGKDPAAELGHF